MRPRVQSPFRGQTDMGFGAKSPRIFNSFCDNTQQTIRHVAQQTGLSLNRLDDPMMAQGHTAMEC